MKIVLKTLGLCIAIFAFNLMSRAQDTTMPSQSGDLEFASKATAGNLFEIQASNLAVAKSQDQNIKQYAQMIIDDHTSAGDELSALVKNKNWQLGTLDNQNYKQMIDRLNNADSANFDRTYIEMMVKSHQDAIALFKEGSTGTATSDTDLRKFATEKVPVFEKHLDQIKNMQPADKTLGSMPTSPGTPSPAMKTKVPKPKLK